jgi:RNA recognition motif-containing protein
MNIYVSNLGFGTQNDELQKQFSRYGEVSSVNIIMDKVTNRSRGFAFVEMSDTNAAEKAIRELNGTNLDGRIIKVNEARKKENNY